MSNYEDDQSEDGELARSPVIQDDMDFSLSDDEHDISDALDIKPPQLTIRAIHSHRSRRGHGRRPGKEDVQKDNSRRDKKTVYRERDKDRNKREMEHKHGDVIHNKDHFRNKDHYRDKNQYREKDVYREKEGRDAYNKEKEAYRDADPYREKEFRKEHRDKERELHRESRHSDPEKRHRHREMENRESRMRHTTEDSNFRPVEKENNDRLTGDKELEDLRSRLLSKRKNQQQHQDGGTRRRDPENVESEKESKHFRVPELDKSQQERRERLLEAASQMARRKESSQEELEARRERSRGNKRAAPSPPPEGRRVRPAASPPARGSPPPRAPSPAHPETVIVSDNSDVDMKSDHSQHSGASNESGSGSSTSSGSGNESGSGTASDSEGEETEPQSEEEEGEVSAEEEEAASSDASRKEKRRSPNSDRTVSDKSHSPHRNPSRSRSRSHSFSPPPKEENGEKATADDAQPKEEPARPLSPKAEDARDKLPPYFPALQGCRSVEEFQCLNRIEEGTYGVVYRARDKTTEEIVALKRLKMEKEKEGFPITSLREINTLLKGQHPNIVTVREIVVGSNMDKIFIVMDYVEHDLKSLMEMMRQRKQAFLPGEIKCLMQQLLKAVHHLHDNWILHRDLKTSNLLLSHKGILKVGDFGLAREYGSPLRNYTPVVVTLWYRAPELLLCSKKYSTPVDMWSVGCIFAEFVMMNALFPGKSEVDQLNRIFKELGTPTERVWPGWNELPAVQKMTFAAYAGGGLKTRAGPDLLSDAGHCLLAGLLTYDPTKRLSADVALHQTYFTEQPLAVEPAMFPTWPAKSEGGRRALGAAHSPKPPSGGGQYKALADADADASRGFRISALTAGGGFSLKF